MSAGNLNFSRFSGESIIFCTAVSSVDCGSGSGADLAAYRLKTQITIRRREPPLELQGHIFAVEIENHVRADAIVDQFYLHVTHRRAHLLQLLGISSGRRRKIRCSVVSRGIGRLGLGWSTRSDIEMRREIRVQLGLIEAKRRGLAAATACSTASNFCSTFAAACGLVTTMGAGTA